MNIYQYDYDYSTGLYKYNGIKVTNRDPTSNNIKIAQQTANSQHNLRSKKLAAYYIEVIYNNKYCKIIWLKLDELGPDDIFFINLWNSCCNWFVL